MKKTLVLIALIQIGVSVAAQNAIFEIDGKVVDSKGRGIENVVVNDGLHFVQTDKNGAWRFSTDTTYCKFVSISTPAAYFLPARDGLAVFYKPMREVVKNVENTFVLTKRKKPCTSFSYIAISDPQVLNEEEMGRWRNETVRDMRQVADSLKRYREVIGMTLGDMMFDNLSLYGEFAQTCDMVGITVFQTIGNHDHDKRYQDLHNMRLGSPVYAEHLYNKYFGPTDYSFNIGNVHVITMKNINYVGRRQYIEAVTDQQLAWLANDLQYVPKGSVVFVNMHAAGWNKEGRDGNFRGAKEVANLMKDYDVHFFCGHTHFFQNIEVTPRFYQHNIGAACGSWWAGDYSVCGAPNGYLVVDVNGNDVKWHFKPTKGDITHQFRVYMPGQFRSQPAAVVANVWDYDPHCKVEYYEDGKCKGAMEQFVDIDEAYIVQQAKLGKKADDLTRHLFRFKPSKGTKEVKIVFTNRFGEQYSQTCKL